VTVPYLSRALTRDTALNLVGQLAPLAIAFLALPATINGLGADRFGILGLAWAILGSAGLVDLALGRAVTRFASSALARGDREAAAVATLNAARAQSILGLAGSLVLAATTPWLVTTILHIPAELAVETRTVFWLVAVAIPAVLVAGCFRGLLEALGRFDLVNAQRFAFGSMTFAIPWLGVALGWGLPSITGALVAARFVSAATHAIAASSILREIRGARADDALGEVVLFGGHITAANLVLSFHRLSDRFLVGALSTLAAVGQFSVASEIALRLAVIPSSVIGASFPSLSAAAASGDAAATRAIRHRMISFLLLLMGPPCAVLVVAAQPMLGWWLGEPMADAASTPLQLLVAGAFVSSFAGIAVASLQASGKPEIVTRLRVWLAAPFFLVQWWAIARWHIDGAAWGALARSAIETAAMIVAAWMASRAGIPVSEANRESPPSPGSS
jgi:O-antigen/teichoic acid export membrane protein